MKLTVPEYFTRFKCIGGACRHSCCVGWDIRIDSDTLCRYSELEGPLGEELRAATAEVDGDVCFVRDGERCRFLDADGLCRIIKQGGEQLLCEICREHPRYYTVLGDRAYGGVGLCCEAAAELILNDNEHRFVELSDFDAEEEECDGRLHREIVDLGRQIVATVLRKQHKFSENLRECCRLCRDYEGAPFEDACCECDGLFDLFLSLDYMGNEIGALINRAAEKYRSGELASDGRLRAYAENLLLYFLNRYFLRAAEFGEAVNTFAAVLALSLILTLIFTACGGKNGISPQKAVDMSVLFSCEVEYSEDNIETLLCKCGEMLCGMVEMFSELEK